MLLCPRPEGRNRFFVWKRLDYCWWFEYLCIVYDVRRKEFYYAFGFNTGSFPLLVAEVSLAQNKRVDITMLLIIEGYFKNGRFFFAFLSFTQTSLYNTREKNVKYLSSSPHWFHVRKTENYLPSVWEYLYFGLYIFSYCWKDVFGSRCWSVFSKCRYVISSHGNHWDHTELEHICILLLLFIRSKQLKHIWTSDTVALTLGRHLCCLPLVLQGFFFFKSDISICVVAAAST